MTENLHETKAHLLYFTLKAWDSSPGQAHSATPWDATARQ